MIVAVPGREGNGTLAMRDCLVPVFQLHGHATVEIVRLSILFVGIERGLEMRDRIISASLHEIGSSGIQSVSIRRMQRAGHWKNHQHGYQQPLSPWCHDHSA